MSYTEVNSPEPPNWFRMGAILVGTIILILMAMSMPVNCHAFGDDSYSWQEAEQQQRSIRPAHDMYEVIPEPPVPVDRSVLKSGMPTTDPQVLVTGKVSETPKPAVVSPVKHKKVQYVKKTSGKLNKRTQFCAEDGLNCDNWGEWETVN